MPINPDDPRDPQDQNSNESGNTAMKNTVLDHPADCGIVWTNGTGADVSAGDVVRVGPLVGVAEVNIASTKTGAVLLDGAFTFNANSSDTWSQGAALTYDFTNKKIVVASAAGPAWFVARTAKLNGETTHVASIRQSQLQFASINRVPTGGEDTANQIDFDTKLGVIPSQINVIIINSSGVVRFPTTTTAGVAVGTVRITDASLVTSDRVFGFFLP
ncbi:MAG: DUF2190 family protein [Phycisphaerales bacterium]|nr:DUF2190 family protein [Phycisphaerales bacterium]